MITTFRNSRTGERVQIKADWLSNNSHIFFRRKGDPWRKTKLTVREVRNKLVAVRAIIEFGY